MIKVLVTSYSKKVERTHVKYNQHKVLNKIDLNCSIVGSHNAIT